MKKGILIIGVIVSFITLLSFKSSSQGENELLSEKNFLVSTSTLADFYKSKDMTEKEQEQFMAENGTAKAAYKLAKVAWKKSCKEVFRAAIAYFAGSAEGDNGGYDQYMKGIIDGNNVNTDNVKISESELKKQNFTDEDINDIISLGLIKQL